jgi:hypothetical protein
VRANWRSGKRRKFVMLEHYLLDCSAWLDLSTNARCVYIDLRRRYNGKNNGFIAFSARDAGAALNRSHHTGNRALAELVDHGLIAVTENSDFNRKVKLARCYRLTEVRDDRPGASAIATKEFLRWQAPEKTKHSLTGENHSRTSETVTTKVA